MSTWMLAVVMLCYGYTGLEALVKGNLWWAGVWLSYAASALFFIFIARQTPS